MKEKERQRLEEHKKKLVKEEMNKENETKSIGLTEETQEKMATKYITQRDCLYPFGSIFHHSFRSPITELVDGTN